MLEEESGALNDVSAQAEGLQEEADLDEVSNQNEHAFVLCVYLY